MRSSRTMLLAFILMLPQLAVAQRRHAVRRPDWTLSGESTLRGPKGYDYGPAIAFSGQNGIAVWTDRTNSGSIDPTLRYSLLDAVGVPMNPAGVSLETAVFAESPAVAANGSGFFVVLLQGDRLLATRISTDGRIVDATPIVVATNVPGFSLFSGGSPRVRVACGDRDCLVTWMDGGVRGALVAANGALLTPDPMMLSGGSIGYDVAWGKDHYLVLSDSGWRGAGTGSTLYATTVVAGHPWVPFPLIQSANTTIVHPTAAWNGSEWLMTWTDFRGAGLASPSFDDIRFARLDGLEHWLDASSDGALLGTIPNPGWVDSPAFTRSEVVWDGKSFAVSWGRSLSRVSAAGRLLDDGLVLPFSTEDITSPGDGKVLLAHSAWSGQTYVAIVRALAE